MTAYLHTDSLTGYELIFGIKNTGGIVLDETEIGLGHPPHMRRDFENGIGLVNPSSATVEIPLEETFYAWPDRRTPKSTTADPSTP